jgi:Undecaprenyl-phosphate glucose phosphotransferase
LLRGRKGIDGALAGVDVMSESQSLGEDMAEVDAYLAAPAAAGSRAGPLGRLSRWQLIFLAKVIDIDCIAILSLLVLCCGQRWDAAGVARYVSWSFAVALACYICFVNARLYDIDVLIDSARAMRRLWGCWTIVFTLLAAVTLLAQQPDLFSRRWFVEFYAGGLLALAAARWSVEQLVRSWVAQGNFTKAVAIVGNNELAAKLAARLHGGGHGIRVIGVFDDRQSGDAALRGRLGSVADLLEYGKANVVDLVVITLPMTAAERISAVSRTLRQQPFNVRILPDMMGLDRYSSIRLPRQELPGVQLLTIADRPIGDWALLAKRLMDVLLATVALVVLSPVFLVCAVGVKASSKGPILFRQKRIGFKGRAFLIYKFRTMHVTETAHTRLTVKNDPRVFRFGDFMRRFSLDELPQLLNVLKGEMSLVGPRPHMPEARAAEKLYLDAVAEYGDRQRVKPGITGWAQVNGWRGPTETIEQIERRVEHDIYYIDNWSIFLDIVILFRTGFGAFFGKNAF